METGAWHKHLYNATTVLGEADHLGTTHKLLHLEEHAPALHNILGADDAAPSNRYLHPERPLQQL